MKLKTVKQSEMNLMTLIDSIHLDNTAWACRKVYDRLKDLGFPIGRHHCATLFRKLGIHCIYRKPRMNIRHIGHKVTPCVLSHLEIAKPNQVGAVDITTSSMARGYVYLTSVIDIYKRKRLSSRVSNTLFAIFCIDASTESVRFYRSRAIIDTNQGPQLRFSVIVAPVVT